MKKGFTLIELMITVALIGLIAAFAIPNYSKAIAKAHERDAILQLTTLHAASQIYKASNGKYYPTDLDNAGDINTALSINIISNNITYKYTAIGAGSGFKALADWGTITIMATETSLNATNPCCSAGSCPSLPNC